MASRKYGDWGKVQATFDQASKRINEAARKALLQEGHRIRGKMIEGIREQAPGGKQFKPLSPLTLAARRLAGFRGTKALIVHGDLRNGITVSTHGAQVFVGILRTARTKQGKQLVNIAEVQEWGALIVLNLTPKMRRFLFGVLFKDERESEIDRPFWLLKGSGKKTIVIRIPARPFVRPTFEAHAQPAEVKQRLEARMAELLKGDFAK